MGFGRTRCCLSGRPEALAVRLGTLSKPLPIWAATGLSRGHTAPQRDPAVVPAAGAGKHERASRARASPGARTGTWGVYRAGIHPIHRYVRARCGDVAVRLGHAGSWQPRSVCRGGAALLCINRSLKLAPASVVVRRILHFPARAATRARGQCGQSAGVAVATAAQDSPTSLHSGARARSAGTAATGPARSPG